MKCDRCKYFAIISIFSRQPSIGSNIILFVVVVSICKDYESRIMYILLIHEICWCVIFFKLQSINGKDCAWKEIKPFAVELHLFGFLRSILIPPRIQIWLNGSQCIHFSFRVIVLTINLIKFINIVSCLRYDVSYSYSRDNWAAIRVKIKMTANLITLPIQLKNAWYPF